jgi:hypothetical protein
MAETRAGSDLFISRLGPVIPRLKIRGLVSRSPARGQPQIQNLSKSSPLPGNLILPGTREGFGREARNGPSGYAPGHEADVGPHPNSFEPTRVFLDIAVEIFRWPVLGRPAPRLRASRGRHSPQLLSHPHQSLPAVRKIPFNSFNFPDHKGGVP